MTMSNHDLTMVKSFELPSVDYACSSMALAGALRLVVAVGVLAWFVEQGLFRIDCRKARLF
jgi:hypothetical protein